jgi:hypothetical protein
MATGEIESLREDIKGLSAEIRLELKAFRDDVNSLKLAIAARGDDSKKLDDHEQRLRLVEREVTVSNTKLALFIGISGALGSVLTAGLMKFVFK